MISTEQWEPWQVHFILTGQKRWFVYRHRLEDNGTRRSVMQSLRNKFNTREAAQRKADTLNADAQD